jgi:hypothetical protein
MGVWTVGTKEHAEMFKSRARKPNAGTADIFRGRNKFLNVTAQNKRTNEGYGGRNPLWKKSSLGK